MQALRRCAAVPVRVSAAAVSRRSLPARVASAAPMQEATSQQQACSLDVQMFWAASLLEQAALEQQPKQQPVHTLQSLAPPVLALAAVVLLLGAPAAQAAQHGQPLSDLAEGVQGHGVQDCSKPALHPAASC